VANGPNIFQMLLVIIIIIIIIMSRRSVVGVSVSVSV